MVIVEIESERFSAEIAPFGAELQSLKDRRSGQEYIWQRDPSVWDRSAPILFPVVGRLKNGRYCLNGQEYSMPLHGFAWISEFTVEETGLEFVQLVLRDSESTRQMYPFEFELRVRFQCLENGLAVSYTVTNPSNESLWFTLGSHPAFALDHAPEQYRLRFSRKETLDLYGIRNELLEKVEPDYLRDESVIELHRDLFHDDALIFLNMVSDSVRLEGNDGFGLTLETGGAPNIGFWAKPGAPYVCIEPWWSVDEAADHDGDLKHRPGVIRLAPQASWRCRYSIAPD